MKHLIQLRELPETDLDRFQRIEISDGLTSITVWEGPIRLGLLYTASLKNPPLGVALTLTIMVDNAWEEQTRSSICADLWPRIAERRGHSGPGWIGSRVPLRF